MYYDYEPGEASYPSPHGIVKGSILLKRQYRIRKEKMEYMIESAVTIYDDILQKELSKGTDDRMKNIIATIQREQNQIIRNENFHTLIIQGVAGSGKTSVALHRVAYLLYAHKGKLDSKDILIISPNKVFADYVSNVLPELGEENIPESSMETFLSGLLNRKYKFLSFYEQVTDLLGKTPAGYTERIKYKSSVEFITQLDRFILHVENNYFRPKDIKIKHITIPAEYFANEFRRFHRYPVRQRFEVMTAYIVEELQRKYLPEISTKEKNRLEKEITAMFAGNNDLQLYKDFFRWLGRPELFKLRKNHTLEYADLAPLAYLHICLEKQKPYSHIKHLIIDEMQDYTPIQYKVLLKMFPCKKTILGDIRQSVNPYGSSTAEIIQKVIAGGEVMKLRKSYRSTYEINEFAGKIYPDHELEAIARHGEQAEIIYFPNREKEIKGITKLLKKFRKSAFNSLGIICRDEMQAAGLYEELKKYDTGIYFLSADSSAFINGIIITSAHMSKGLEFDEVIIPFVHSESFQSEIEKSMLYISVTRAMHKLTLTHHKPLPPYMSSK